MIRLVRIGIIGVVILILGTTAACAQRGVRGELGAAKERIRVLEGERDSLMAVTDSLESAIIVRNATIRGLESALADAVAEIDSLKSLPDAEPPTPPEEEPPPPEEEPPPPEEEEPAPPPPPPSDPAPTDDLVIEAITYATLRLNPCEPAQTIAVDSPVRAAGVFECFEGVSGPLGHGDDAGSQIASSNGNMWVRQFEGPVELDWYADAVYNGAFVSDLLDKLAAAYAPNLYLRAPSSLSGANGWTLFWEGTWDLSCSGHGIERFRFLESDAKVTLAWGGWGSHQFLLFDEPKGGVCTQDASEFLVGSPVPKASRDDYNLTIDGGVDGPSSTQNDNLIEVRPGSGVAGYDVIFRANTRNAERGGFRTIAHAGALDTVLVAGRHESAGFTIQGANVGILEDTVYYSDPYLRHWGWTGSGSETDFSTYCHDCKVHVMNTQRLEGSLESEYGGNVWFFAGVEYIGKSVDEPFTFIRNNHGYSHTGAFVEDAERIAELYGKVDPVQVGGTPTDGRRFLRFIEGRYDWGDPDQSDGVLYEQTNEGCTSNAIWYATHIEAEFVGWKSNVRTAKGQACGDLSGQSYGHRITGSADAGNLQVTDRVTVEGTFDDVRAIRIPMQGDATQFSPCSGSRIQNSRLSGGIRIDDTCVNTTVANVTLEAAAMIEAEEPWICEGAGTQPAGTVEAQAVPGAIDNGNGTYTICQ